VSHGAGNYEQEYPYQTWRVTPPDTPPAPAAVCRQAGCSNPAGDVEGLCDRHHNQQAALRKLRCDGRTGARLFNKSTIKETS
jgi:hypothetical protein